MFMVTIGDVLGIIFLGILLVFALMAKIHEYASNRKLDKTCEHDFELVTFCHGGYVYRCKKCGRNGKNQ